MLDQNWVQQYKAINWNSLLRKEFWEYSLEEAKPIFDRIKKFFDEILNNPEVENLSQSIHNKISAKISSFVQFCDSRIKTYQNTSEKSQKIEEIRNIEYEIIEELWKYISYFSELDPKKEKEYKKYTEDAKEKIKEVEIRLSEIDKLSERAKQIAQKEEIASFWNFFGITAISNETSAKNAQYTMIGLILLTWIFAIIFLWGINFSQQTETSWWKNIFLTIHEQNIIERIVILSLLWFLISHFSKIYSAEKHLYVLNNQRQNALNSHRQIIDSVQSTNTENDLETKNAILLQMTKAIFDNQDTWYLKDSWWSPIITNQILEAWKILSKT